MTRVSLLGPPGTELAARHLTFSARGTAAAIKEAVSHLADPRQIKGVAVTGMGMDGLPVDEAGQAVAIGQQFEFAACRLIARQGGVQALGRLLDGV